MTEDIKDALKLLEELGGSMALENCPLAHLLLEEGYVEEGGLDKFGRKTLKLANQGNPQQDFWTPHRRQNNRHRGDQRGAVTFKGHMDLTETALQQGTAIHNELESKYREWLEDFPPYSLIHDEVIFEVPMGELDQVFGPSTMSEQDSDFWQHILGAWQVECEKLLRPRELRSSRPNSRRWPEIKIDPSTWEGRKWAKPIFIGIDYERTSPEKPVPVANMADIEDALRYSMFVAGQALKKQPHYSEDMPWDQFVTSLQKEAHWTQVHFTWDKTKGLDSTLACDKAFALAQKLSRDLGDKSNGHVRSDLGPDLDFSDRELTDKVFISCGVLHPERIWHAHLVIAVSSNGTMEIIKNRENHLGAKIYQPWTNSMMWCYGETV